MLVLGRSEYLYKRWMSAAKRQNIALKNSLFSGRRFVRRLFEHRAVRFWQWWLLRWKSRPLFLHKMWMFGSRLLTFLMVQKNLSNDSITIASCCCLTIFFFQFSTFINSKLSVDIVIIVVIQDFVLPEKKIEKSWF